ncbi:hypothetical protein Tco_0606331, partial [Tanacetum coccineum]
KGFLSRADSDDQIHDERQSDSSSNNGMAYHRENFQELPNDTVNEQTHDEPQFDTSSNNGMNYHQENSQELQDIADESQTIITRNNVGSVDKIDSLTEICGSLPEYDIPVQEKHRVLDYGRMQLLPPTETVESSDQYHDGSDDRIEDTHHFNPSQQTLELESAPQSPSPSLGISLHDKYQSDRDEPEVHDAFDPVNSSENNEDNLSCQGGSVEAEEWEEPIIGNTDIEWHHLTSPESNEGLDANSIENDDEWYQGTVPGDDYDTADNWFGARTDAIYTYDGDSSNRLELRELSSRRRVSNLLQSGFSLRLDQLLQSYVERQEQASQSDDEWMLEHEQQDLDQQSVFENDVVSQAVQSAEGAHSSPPAIPQHSGTEWDIINGLRIDMVRLQEQMNSMQSTLETCMKMQHELRRSVQQEVSSALSRLSTSGEDNLETCFLCCDNRSDFSPDREKYVRKKRTMSRMSIVRAKDESKGEFSPISSNPSYETVEVNLRGLLELDKSDLSGNKDRDQLRRESKYNDCEINAENVKYGPERYRCARTELITPDLTCPSTHQLLRNSGGDSGPDLSFDKSASPERLFSLARVSLAKIEPTVTLFRVFQTLCKQGDWFSFSKRHAPSPVCIDDNRSCMKHWKSGFFLIDRRAISDAMVWRHPDAAIDDPRPAAGSFNMADVRRLSAHVIKLRDMPEGVLVLSGLSRVWKNRFCDPVLRGADGNGMGVGCNCFALCPWILLLAFIVVFFLQLWVFMIFSAFLSGPDLAVGTPSSKIVAKAEASQKRKASTSGAASIHVAKRTRSALAQSSGITTRPNLFVGDSDDESDGDADACVEILLVTPLRSGAVIPPSGNQGRSSATPTTEGSNTRDSQGKGIMVDDAAAPSGGVSRQRPSFGPAPSFRDVSGDAIHTNFFPFFAGLYYAPYPEDGVARNCEFTREE